MKQHQGRKIAGQSRPFQKKSQPTNQPPNKKTLSACPNLLQFTHRTRWERGDLQPLSKQEWTIQVNSGFFHIKQTTFCILPSAPVKKVPIFLSPEHNVLSCKLILFNYYFWKTAQLHSFFLQGKTGTVNGNRSGQRSAGPFGEEINDLNSTIRTGVRHVCVGSLNNPIFVPSGTSTNSSQDEAQGHRWYKPENTKMHWAQCKRGTLF